MKPSFLIATAGAVLLLSGCNMLGRGVAVDLVLPGAPEGWPAELRIHGYRVEYRSETGELRRTRVSGSTRRLELTIPGRSGLAVLVYPSFAEGAFAVKPAAAVYPYDLHGDAELRVSYDRGFAGVVLHRALFTVPSFNSRRLIEEVDARGAGDPWRFDLQRVIEKLAARAFSTIYLRARDTVEVEVEAAAGRWVRANPHAPALQTEATPEGPRLRMELTPGHHRLLHLGEHRVLSAVVDEDGGVRVLRR